MISCQLSIRCVMKNTNSPTNRTRQVRAHAVRSFPQHASLWLEGITLLWEDRKIKYIYMQYMSMNYSCNVMM